MGTDLRAVRLAAPDSTHPCISCGACCAFFRVSFYWREANADEHKNAVPIELTEDVSSTDRCMKGTNVHHNNKCIALKGKIGEKAWCSIYEKRSSTCRNFEASYERGIKNPRCDEARAKHGMRPLTKDDFKAIDKIKYLEF